MGARGPHDDFDTAAARLREGYAGFSERQDLEELRRDWVSPDLEYVTRHGTFHGTDRYFSEIEVQQRKWRIETEVEEIVDAGEGALVILAKVRRVDGDSGEVVWKAWPAAVVRVLDGKLVFFEGYVDRRAALAALGVEQG
jgi:ketosteroid isomerase-like protein